jgi:hypothetical protein
MPWLSLRTVVLEDADCASDIDAAKATYHRFAEIWDGVEWLLARNTTPPGSFLSVTNANGDFYILGVRGDAGIKTPDLWVFYQFNDDEVRVHGINAFDAVQDAEED